MHQQTTPIVLITCDKVRSSITIHCVLLDDANYFQKNKNKNKDSCLKPNVGQFGQQHLDTMGRLLPHSKKFACCPC